MYEIATPTEIRAFLSDMAFGRSDACLVDVLEAFTGVMRNEEMPMRTRLEAGVTLLKMKSDVTVWNGEIPVLIKDESGRITDPTTGKEYIIDDRGICKIAGECGSGSC